MSASTTPPFVDSGRDADTLSAISGIALRHAHGRDGFAACFPAISRLRPALENVAEWVERASEMAAGGYRVLAAWEGEQVRAVAGYRILENLIHGRFLYVDDLVTEESHRSRGLGAALLAELTAIAIDERCRRLVLDTGLTNAAARRFYKREGLIEFAVGFMKPLQQA